MFNTFTFNSQTLPGGSFTRRSYGSRPVPTVHIERVRGDVRKAKPVSVARSFTTTYEDTTVLADDPVALADDPEALAGQYVSAGLKPEAIAHDDIIQAEVVTNKAKGVVEWPSSPQASLRSPTSTQPKLLPRITIPHVIIKSIPNFGQ